jgi:hypothetical protein
MSVEVPVSSVLTPFFPSLRFIVHVLSAAVLLVFLLVGEGDNKGSLQLAAAATALPPLSMRIREIARLAQFSRAVQSFS